ncbi:MAG TPA: galactose-1-phosphate uridylyltransferase [Nitrospiraceae bacterium]|nr:galactose-1-phosphate uridylyltransferase [Nitrospiraceae bacterium]
MSELRLNLITQEWVIIDQDKCKKPEDFINKTEVKSRLEFSSICPFCRGNELCTPGELYRQEDENKKWKIRVVPNKFGRLSREGERTRWDVGLKKGVAGIGVSEVIIESPIHNHTLATMPLENVERVIQTSQARFIEAYRDPNIEYVAIFKNSGPASGTSITHPHSQVVGIPVIPLEIHQRVSAYMKFSDENGECLVCRVLEDELIDGRRILLTTEHFVTFVPYAALSPFHIWIFPRRHSGSFSNISGDEIQDLARHLKSIFGKLYRGLEDPDYNYIIRSGKLSEAELEYQHWYVAIVPRVATGSGFELGTGIYVNPLVPEISAAFIRKITVPE